jgi:RNA polymerase sigma-70 factor (ECF subfamily)
METTGEDKPIGYTLFERLYSRHHQQVFAFLLGMTGEFSLAEDLLQEVFVSFARNLKNIDAEGNVLAYLLKSAKHKVANYWRRHERQKNFREQYRIFLVKEKTGLTGENCECEKLRKLEQALAKLPDEEREVILLKTKSGLKFREIATVLQIPQGTAATRYRTALARLRETMTDE